MKEEKILIRIMDGEGAKAPIAKARVSIYAISDDQAQAKKGRKYLDVSQDTPVFKSETNGEGYLSFDADPGSYLVVGDAFGHECREEVYVESGCTSEVILNVPVGFEIQSYVMTEECGPPVPCDVVTSGSVVKYEAIYKLSDKHLSKRPVKITWISTRGSFTRTGNEREIYLNTAGLVGQIIVTSVMSEIGSAHVSVSSSLGALLGARHGAGAGAAGRAGRVRGSPADPGALASGHPGARAAGEGKGRHAEAAGRSQGRTRQAAR